MFNLWPTPRLSLGVEIFLKGAGTSVICPAVMRQSTSPAKSHAFIRIDILLIKFVSIFAMGLGPLFGSMCRNAQCKPMLATIVKLLLSGGPSAIRRFVVPIIIFPVKSHLWRAHAHIGHKIFKASSFRRDTAPAFANGNASATPIWIIFAIFIFAASNHAGPSVVHGLQSSISHIYTPFEFVDVKLY